jgi:hypothetical protein
VFDLPQPILNQLLTMRNTAPERLSEDEMQIARRVCRCGFCHSLWVRRKTQIPDRCPKCHKPGWDRPFIHALLAAQPSTTKPSPSARKKDDTSGGLA